MEWIYKNNRENKFIFIMGCIIGLLCALPFISNLIYSIDDYHLWNVYDINWETMGYNFYSTGRIVEGILAEILFRFNLQPLNRPMGMVVFIASLAMFGTLVGKLLNIRNIMLKFLICILIVLNPFNTEIFYYSNITVYSGIAVFFLTVGFWYSHQYVDKKRRVYLLYSCFFYCLSLGVYQIFYPMVFFIILLAVIRDFNENEMQWRKYAIYSGIYFLSFLLFYIFLKFMFAFIPPSLIYEGIDLGEFIKKLFSPNYYIRLLGIVKQYYGDTILHSSLAFGSVVIGSGIICILGLLNVHRDKRIVYFVGVCLFLLLGPVMCIGFGLARPDDISARTFTSYGVYLGGLLLIDYYYLRDICKKKESIKEQCIKIVTIVFAVICFINGSLIGKAANNIIRLNNKEANMVNRIVGRMEEFEEFTGYEPLVIQGVPMLSGISDKSLGNLGQPASASFSKVLLFNEVSGYSFSIPNAEQVKQASKIIDDMSTWPQKDSVAYIDGIFVVRLYW